LLLKIPSIGNLKKLEQAVQQLKDIPGALTKNGPLLKALEYGVKKEFLTDVLAIDRYHGRLSTARGAMYEVEKALELIESGEEIINLGLEVKGMAATREFDIVTKTKKEVADAFSKLCQQKQIALEKGKIFEMHSRQMIPNEIKEWLCKKGINFFEDIL
jgi:hypothetical protein